MISLSFPIYDSNQPGSTPLGPTIINAFSALQIPAYWRAVNFLAGNLASFPRAVYLSGVKIAHAVDRVLERKPNPYQTATVFWRQLFFDAVSQGNGYGRIDRTKPASIGTAGITNLMSEDVTPFRYEGVQYYFDKKSGDILAAADVLHLPGLGYDGMQGYSPIYLMREALQRSRTIDLYATRHLTKGTVLRGAIEFPAGLTEEKLETTLAKIRAHTTGPSAERDILLLPDGAKLNPSTLPPETQVADRFSYSIKQISQITGVPPHFLYEDGDAKYNATVEQAGEEVVRYTFRPWMDVIEDELTTKLLTEAEQAKGFDIKLDPNALLRGSTKEQSAIVVEEVTAGVRTRNEGRAQLNLAADADPASNKLNALGETGQPASGAPVKGAPVKNSALAAFKPILAAAVVRVDGKTAKAFENKAGKPTPERTVWANVFAEEQSRYVHDALQPVSDALIALGQPAVNVQKIANRYAGAVRRRNADGTIVTLATILKEELTDEQEKQPG